MGRLQIKQLIIFVFALAVVTILSAALVWHYSYIADLRRIKSESAIALNQTLDQFQSQLSSFRLLPTVIARDRSVVQGLSDGFFGTDVREFIVTAHDLSGAHEVKLLDREGNLVISSNWEVGEDEAARSDAARPHFQTAMTGAMGYDFFYDRATQQRRLSFARSVLSDTKQQIGVVAVEVDVERFEREIRSLPEAVMLTDQQGVVYLTNRPRLIFTKPVGGDTKSGRRDLKIAYPEDVVRLLDVRPHAQANGLTLWKTDDMGLLPETGLMVRRHVPQLDSDAILLAEIGPAVDYATLNATLAAAISSLLMVVGFSIWQYRRNLLSRLRTEQKLTAELDQRVAERSAQLEHAQTELVQTAKLSALGKMSVGISHELNQPVATIQNFAVNAKRLLDRGNADATQDNLVEIEQQTTRMQRIIQNLRSFARKDDMPKGPVDMAAVLSQAVKLSSQRLDQESVQIRLTGADKSAIVTGGVVRLEQVMVNLIENAIDAMAKEPVKTIDIELSQIGDKTVVTVRDTGPGLDDPDRVFEPFYTTKSADGGDGLGLGLSISYGFVESFDGTLQAQNHTDGGAILTLTLPSAQFEEA